MKRKPDETYEDYRIRRVEDQKKLKEYLKGRVVWFSRLQGPYRRSTKAV